MSILIKPVSMTIDPLTAAADVAQLITAIAAALTVIVAAFIAYRSSRREDEERREHDRVELRRSREALGIDLTHCAYGFYHHLEEMYRRIDYGEFIEAAFVSTLGEQFTSFRITARVLEQRLEDLSLVDRATAVRLRWLWHGVVDVLVARYYWVARSSERFEGLVRRHGLHPLVDGPDKGDIPADVQRQLPTAETLRDPAKSLGAFEVLLNEVLVGVRDRTDPAVLLHPNYRRRESKPS